MRPCAGGLLGGHGRIIMMMMRPWRIVICDTYNNARVDSAILAPIPKYGVQLGGPTPTPVELAMLLTLQAPGAVRVLDPVISGPVFHPK